jgi:hypothetical protein
VFVLSLVAQSQEKVSLTGLVVDKDGAVIPGAKVRIGIPECNCAECTDKKACSCCVDQVVTTSAEGRFSASVAPGRYKITAQTATASEHKGEVTANVTAAASNEVRVTVH